MKMLKVDLAYVTQFFIIWNGSGFLKKNTKIVVTCIQKSNLFNVHECKIKIRKIKCIIGCVCGSVECECRPKEKLLWLHRHYHELANYVCICDFKFSFILLKVGTKTAHWKPGCSPLTFIHGSFSFKIGNQTVNPFSANFQNENCFFFKFLKVFSIEMMLKQLFIDLTYSHFII